jgi:hypothetical protein
LVCDTSTSSRTTSGSPLSTWTRYIQSPLFMRYNLKFVRRRCEEHAPTVYQFMDEGCRSCNPQPQPQSTCGHANGLWSHGACRGTKFC